jgi:hypothetical protein
MPQPSYSLHYCPKKNLNYWYLVLLMSWKPFVCNFLFWLYRRGTYLLEGYNTLFEFLVDLESRVVRLIWCDKCLISDKHIIIIIIIIIYGIVPQFCEGFRLDGLISCHLINCILYLHFWHKSAIMCHYLIFVEIIEKVHFWFVPRHILQ